MLKFIEIGTGFYCVDDVVSVEKAGVKGIKIRLCGGDNDHTMVGMLFNNEEERDKEWSRITPIFHAISE